MAEGKQLPGYRYNMAQDMTNTCMVWVLALGGGQSSHHPSACMAQHGNVQLPPPRVPPAGLGLGLGTPPPYFWVEKLKKRVSDPNWTFPCYAICMYDYIFACPPASHCPIYLLIRLPTPGPSVKRISPSC